jgi:hypothetical protein
VKAVILVFSLAHGALALLLGAISLLLMAMAGAELWRAALAGLNSNGAESAIEAVGLVAIAILTLQVSHGIVESEVVRDAHLSAPTRARRYLSRFLVVVVVAITIEGLVAAFKAIHDDPSMLVQSATLFIGAGILLAAWGLFVRLNRAAEDVEPEQMDEAKREDEKLKV